MSYWYLLIIFLVFKSIDVIRCSNKGKSCVGLLFSLTLLEYDKILCEFGSPQENKSFHVIRDPIVPCLDNSSTAEQVILPFNSKHQETALELDIWPESALSRLVSGEAGMTMSDVNLLPSWGPDTLSQSVVDTWAAGVLGHVHNEWADMQETLWFLKGGSLTVGFWGLLSCSRVSNESQMHFLP